MLKVLHFIKDLDVAGAQTVVMNYLRFFYKDKDVEMEVAVLERSNNSAYEQECVKNDYSISFCDYKSNSIPVISTLINWVKFQWIFYKKIRDVKPDIVHVHGTNLLVFASLPILFSRTKVNVHTLHSDPYDYSPRFVRWAKFAFHIVGIFPICVTESQANKAVKRYKIKKYAIIRNGIDARRFQNINRDDVRNELGISSSTKVIGCVGRFDLVKNHTFLLKIFSEYLKHNADALLLLVGEGQEKNNLISLAKQLSIEEKVLFTGLRTDVERMYFAMDVFMLTSLFESSSIVTVEAQFAGVRCVVADSIPDSVVLTTKVNRMPLDAPVGKWIAAIEGNLSTDKKKGNLDDFSMENSVLQLKQLYYDLLVN